jgi:hypothetical protein
MIIFRHLLSLCILVLLETPLLAGDPRPPQINLSFLAEPAPIVQYVFSTKS